MDDEPKHDVFDFKNACSVDFVDDLVFACDAFAISLNLKPLPNSLKYIFLVPDESLLVIITFDLDQDHEGK